MRVISGIYKRRRFDVPRTFKARPTTDFAKENLFNVLSNYIDFEEGVTALDLFAGTGSISIELISRGCDRVISIEKDREHHAFICKIMKEVQTEKCLPVRGDVFKFINGGREQFDFIFADPPYELKELGTLRQLLILQVESRQQAVWSTAYSLQQRCQQPYHRFHCFLRPRTFYPVFKEHLCTFPLIEHKYLFHL